MHINMRPHFSPTEWKSYMSYCINAFLNAKIYPVKVYFCPLTSIHMPLRMRINLCHIVFRRFGPFSYCVTFPIFTTSSGSFYTYLSVKFYYPIRTIKEGNKTVLFRTNHDQRLQQRLTMKKSVLNKKKYRVI